MASGEMSEDEFTTFLANTRPESGPGPEVVDWAVQAWHCAGAGHGFIW